MISDDQDDLQTDAGSMDVEGMIHKAEGELCVPRFFDQYTPIAINHACFATAERLILASFDKDAGKPKLSPAAAMEIAGKLFFSAFNFERSKLMFSEIARSLNMPDLYAISIEVDARKMAEEEAEKANEY